MLVVVVQVAQALLGVTLLRVALVAEARVDLLTEFLGQQTPVVVVVVLELELVVLAAPASSSSNTRSLLRLRLT